MIQWDIVKRLSIIIKGYVLCNEIDYCWGYMHVIISSISTHVLLRHTCRMLRRSTNFVTDKKWCKRSKNRFSDFVISIFKCPTCWKLDAYNIKSHVNFQQTWTFSSNYRTASCLVQLCMPHRWTSSSSSSYRTGSTDIPDPLSPLLPIVHRPRQVFRTTSRILT